MDYQIEIKQIVDYPRCRIYRSFFRDLMEDRNIRTNGSSYLFYYMVLCSFANFRSSNRRIEGISYLISPGEWICTLSDLSEWFRVRFQHQALAILDYLQTEHYISYCKLARGNLIKFTISDWKENNTWLEYNYPCAKDIGFFFSRFHCTRTNQSWTLFRNGHRTGSVAPCHLQRYPDPGIGHRTSRIFS